MAKPNPRIVAPATENRTVITRRRKNADLRTREHLTADEVECLIEAAKDNRHGHRDELMVLLTFRHGLRAGRGLRSALGAGRLQDGDTTCPSRQERHAGQPSPDRPRDAGAPPAPARKSTVAVRVRF